MTLDTKTLTIDDMNLDGYVDPQDLWDIWKATNSVRPISFARQLFPEAPKGFVRATKDLGNYASNKATAMRCRLDGKINEALMYEGICERIYNELPEYAKW
jgi:hypothetical protein